MPSASALFLLSFCFRNLHLEIFSERAGNFCRIFIRQDQVPVRRRAGGEAQGTEAPPAAGQGGLAGGARPCPWGLTSWPSDAYKFPKTLKTWGRSLFPEARPRCAVNSNPSSGSHLKLMPALCRSGDRSRRALHRHAFL